MKQLPVWGKRSVSVPRPVLRPPLIIPGISQILFVCLFFYFFVTSVLNTAMYSTDVPDKLSTRGPEGVEGWGVARNQTNRCRSYLCINNESEVGFDLLGPGLAGIPRVCSVRQTEISSAWAPITKVNKTEPNRAWENRVGLETGAYKILSRLSNCGSFQIQSINEA